MCLRHTQLIFDKGDEKREAKEIEKFDKKRNQAVKKHTPKELENVAAEE
ncbi:hypothetical protein K0U27_02105 [archaeon]|nr:hypothetical protein [archaeon]